MFSYALFQFYRAGTWHNWSLLVSWYQINCFDLAGLHLTVHCLNQALSISRSLFMILVSSKGVGHNSHKDGVVRIQIYIYLILCHILYHLYKLWTIRDQVLISEGPQLQLWSNRSFCHWWRLSVFYLIDNQTANQWVCHKHREFSVYEVVQCATPYQMLLIYHTRVREHYKFGVLLWEVDSWRSPWA